MRLDDATYEYIKGEVIDTFVRYKICCIPISGFELAMQMGIKLMPYSSLSSLQLAKAMIASPDGLYLEPGDGEEFIFYNDTQGYERTNMTVLHEIGHAVLGHDDNTDPDIAEAEAGFFAKYASAPPPLVHRTRPSNPLQIQQKFQISSEAAEYAFDYYRKWLRFGDYDYTEYEIIMLEQFATAM